MIVDRLFPGAELRPGGERQKEVRIGRTDVVTNAPPETAAEERADKTRHRLLAATARLARPVIFHPQS